MFSFLFGVFDLLLDRWTVTRNLSVLYNRETQRKCQWRYLYVCSPNDRFWRYYDNMTYNIKENWKRLQTGLVALNPWSFVNKRDYSKNYSFCKQLKACLNYASGFNVNFAFIIPQPQPIDSQLRGCIGDFLRTVQDPDLVCVWFTCQLTLLGVCSGYRKKIQVAVIVVELSIKYSFLFEMLVIEAYCSFVC